MTRPFCPGYAEPPYRGLCEDYPGTEAYPSRVFRHEWGAVFHRGRLDGSARVLVIGLAPGQLEVLVRRVIVGHAGQRLQGLLAKVGIERSYVMVNTFLYSIYSPGEAAAYQDHPLVVAYRNRWLDALMLANPIEAVIALGARADGAWQAWRSGPGGQLRDPAYVRLPHPTQPESSSKGDPERYALAMERMLGEFNQALPVLRRAITRPDVERSPVPYGTTLRADEVLPIPSADLPAGLPAWMGERDHWTHRAGESALRKRCTLTITVPGEVVQAGGAADARTSGSPAGPAAP